MGAYEKTVMINGKLIHFKHNVQTHELYKETFQTDLKADLASLARMDNNYIEATFGVYPQLLWALAKTVDSTIPPFVAWYKQLGEINILAVCEELIPLFE
ncbi:MAG: hypothetical protein ABTA16_03390 [Niallia sp.]